MSNRHPYSSSVAHPGCAEAQHIIRSLFSFRQQYLFRDGSDLHEFLKRDRLLNISIGSECVDRLAVSARSTSSESRPEYSRIARSRGAPSIPHGRTVWDDSDRGLAGRDRRIPKSRSSRAMNRTRYPHRRSPSISPCNPCSPRHLANQDHVTWIIFDKEDGLTSKSWVIL